MDDSFRIDKSAFSITSLEEQQAEEMAYWLNQTPHERLQAVEMMRQIIYGYDPATTRLQRVLEVVECAWR
jgi:hypothetical protein